MELKDGDLEGVKNQEGLHWHWVRLEEVEVVVESSGVQGWENEVAGLDQDEAGPVVEHPARVAKHVREDLRQPQEAEY